MKKHTTLFLGFCFILINTLSAQLISRTSPLPKDNPMVTISTLEVSPTLVRAQFTPNTNCAKYNSMIGEISVLEQWASQMGVEIDDLVSQWGFEDTSESIHEFTELTSNVEYTIFARPFDANGNPYPMQTIVITTGQYGGNGLSVIDLEVTEITDTTARLIAQANEETAVFFDGLITTDYLNEVGVDSAVKIIQASPYPQYQSDDWIWLNLIPNTDYYAIAIGKNALDEWGDTTFVKFKTSLLQGIEENHLKHEPLIYPQPNNGIFTIDGVKANSTLRIFDMQGKCVHIEQLLYPQQPINASHIPSGNYLLQIGNIKAKHPLLIVK